MIVDLLLLPAHARHILLQRHELPFPGLCAFKAEQLNEFIAIRKIGIEADFDNRPERLVKSLELFGLLNCKLLEPAKNLGGKNLTDFCHHRA